MGKGASFERKICKQLSEWWVAGRDDIFWRSCQSGGRATERAKKGKTTYGSYGDIAAVDPVGSPLIKLFTIELKRGRSHGCPTDLVDAPTTKCIRPFEATLNQATQSAEQAWSRYWLLICQRDRKVPMVYAPARLHKDLGEHSPFLLPPTMRFDLCVNQGNGLVRRLRFISLPLEEFLQRVSPKLLLTLLPTSSKK